MAEAQILDTTSRLVSRKTGNSSKLLSGLKGIDCRSLGDNFYREHEIPGEGYAGITPKSSLGGRNASMVGS